MGKESSAPAPDPRLTDAQIESMGYQNQLIQRLIDNSDELLPLQREQMRFGLDAARTAFDQSQDDRQWTLGRRGALSGLQDRLVSDASTFDTEGRRQELAAEAMGDVNQAFDNTRQQGMRTMARMGVNPNDGRMGAFNQQNNQAQALATATAANKVRQAARAEGYQLTDRATNALAGYPAMGMQATQAGAGYGTSGLGMANQGLAGMNSGYGAAGGLAGQMGANATNMWGQQATYHTNNRSQDTLGGLLGGAGGLAMGLSRWSDRRLKTNIEPVGRHAGTGLTIYEFSYIGDPEGRRFEGVMADEVERVVPEAVHEDLFGYRMVDYGLLGIEMKEVA